MSQEKIGKVLIVDDEKINTDIIEKLLNTNKIETITCNDPTQIKTLLQEHSIDLIMLDMMMPKISGMQVLDIVRKHKSNLELPIIMVTGQIEEETIVKALQKGANDYICKPINFEITLARVNTQLKMAKLNQDSIKAQEFKAINAMVTTYNHEINNPLSSASQASRKVCEKIASSDENYKYVEILDRSLNRITEIVKKIERVTDKNYSFTEYVGNSQMIDFHDKNKSDSEAS